MARVSTDLIIPRHTDETFARYRSVFDASLARRLGVCSVINCAAKRA